MRRAGFTLLEIMIVLVLISAIAAFTVPNLLESQKAGHESGAEKTLKTILDAEADFMKADFDNDGKDFCYNLLNLNAQQDAAGNAINLIPSMPATGIKEGYTYFELGDYDELATPGTDPKYGFAYAAVPTVYGTTGRRTYICNQTGSIFYKDLGATVLTNASTWSAQAPSTGNGWNLLGE